MEPVKHKTPTDPDIRQRILDVPDERRRYGFMAQYLWLGRVSEVFGKYMPTKDNFRLTEFEVYDGNKVNTVEAVMFIVKTAKRKGMLRPVALPLDEKYEPWARPVYEYMRDNDQEHPFSLHENVETSKKYAMTTSRKMFDGIWYPYADYTRGVPEPYTQEMILHKRYDKKGYDEWLVQLPDGRRGWTSNTEIVIMNVPVNARWKRGTSHLHRKHRNMLLRNHYRFDGTDRAIMGGWTEKSQDKSVPDAQKYYTFLDLSELNESNIMELKNQAARYFDKLLIPYSRII